MVEQPSAILRRERRQRLRRQRLHQLQAIRRGQALQRLVKQILQQTHGAPPSRLTNQTHGWAAGLRAPSAAIRITQPIAKEMPRDWTTDDGRWPMADEHGIAEAAAADERCCRPMTDPISS